MMWLTNDVLRRVLFENNRACCLCLKTTEEDGFCIYDTVFLDKPHSTLELAKIICSVFGNKFSEHQFVSSTVCEECCKSVLNAYKFIQKCLKINETISSSICNLKNNLESTDIGHLGRTKGMYVAVHPQSSQITVYLDYKKTVKSTLLLAKRFQSFCRTELISYNSDYKRDRSKKLKAYFNKLDRMTCQLCGRSCCSKYTLKRHMIKYCKNTKNHFSAYDDDDDDNNVDDLFNLQTDNRPRMKSQKKNKALDKVFCDHCKRSFKSKQSLKIHIHNRCKNVPFDAKVSVCSQCGEVVDKNSMKLHVMSHSVVRECSKCGKVFKTERAYTKHLLIPNCKEKPVEFNHGPKEFSCHICGSQFNAKKSLNEHMKARHIGVGFPCSICKKKLATSHGLKGHMVVHTKEKNFMCTICGGKFVSKHSLLYHTRTHTGEKPYKCKYCDDRFLSASRRSLHIRIHHLPPQLECKYCTKKFTNWGTLNKHRKRHFNPGSSLYIEELDSETNNLTK